MSKTAAAPVALMMSVLTSPARKAGAFTIFSALSLMLGWGVFSVTSRRTHTRKRDLIRSLVMSLWSLRLFNMFVSSWGLAYVVRRTIGSHRSNMWFFAGFFPAMWYLLFQFTVKEVPRVRYKRTCFNVSVAEKAQLAIRHLLPTYWAFNRHAQTGVLIFISELEWLWSKPIGWSRETVVSDVDGQDLMLDWATHGYSEEDESHVDSDAPIVLMIHGLGDNRNIAYIKRFARHCEERGWRAVAFSYWRCDFGETRDLEAVVRHLQTKNPNCPISAVAWSAGGHLLLRYLQESGKKTPLTCAISISGCFDFLGAISDVTQNENAAYNMYLVEQARTCLRRHLEHDSSLVESDRIELSRIASTGRVALIMYDQFLSIKGDYSSKGADGQSPKTVQLGNQLYQLKCNRSHYESSALANMHKVAVSTLIIHAHDDPVVSTKNIDFQKIVQNKHIVTMTTKRGGHCAYFSGWTPFGPTWADLVASRYISAVFEVHSQTSFLIDLVKRSLLAEEKLDTLSPLVGPAAPTKTGSFAAMSRILSASDLRSFK